MHVREQFSLDGRTAVVTGGAGYKFGADIVCALAEAGARVLLTSRDVNRAKQKAEEYRSAGLQADGLKFDPATEDGIRDFVGAALTLLGRVDILVNNACANHLEPFETVNVEDWNRVLHVNVTAPMLLTRMLSKPMLAQGKGNIINISSIYGMVSPDQRIYGESGLNSPLVYGVSKAALIQMTRHWSTIWAPTIRVNCISPGGSFDNQDPSFVNNYCARTPMGRMAAPGELKGAALFLASDASAWMTGQNVVVDGGLTAW